MRELNTTEIEAISGAGLFSNWGSQLGNAIGNIVNWGSQAVTGKAPAASANPGASNLGAGIGEIVDVLANRNPAGIPSAVETTGLGITQIVAAAVTNGSSAKA